jgi:hypothetical protein
MKTKIIFFLSLFSLMLFQKVPAYAIFESKDKQQVIELDKQVNRLKEELNTVISDRDNLLKQAKNIQIEKEQLMSKIEQVKGASSGAEVEAESLKKETAIMQSEIDKLKAARAQDQKLHM